MSITRMLRLIKILFLLVMIYIFTLTVVFTIPNKSVEQNSISKIDLLIETDNSSMSYGKLKRYLPVLSLDHDIPVDAFTDIVMLSRNINFNTTNNNIAFGVQRFFQFPNKFQEDYYSNPLKAAINMNGYHRYWHGYEVFLRPFLYFFTYETIRYINVLVLSILIFIVGHIFYKLLGTYIAIFYALGLLMCKIFIVPFCMQYMNMICLMLTGIIALDLLVLSVKEKNDNNSNHELFMTFTLVLGSLTAFFDLLTTPLLPIGMSVFFYITYNYKALNICVSQIYFIMFFITWAIGYIVTWAMKWVMTMVVLDINIFHQAIQQALMRIKPISINDTGNIITANGINALQYNINMLAEPVNSVLFIKISLLMILFLLVLSVLYPNKGVPMSFKLQLIIVASMPFIWYVIVVNHSFIHCFFTYRSLMVSIISIGTYFYYSVDWLAVKNIVK